MAEGCCCVRQWMPPRHEFVRVNTGHAAVRVGSGGSVEGFPVQGVVEAAGEFDDDGGTCGGLDARPGTGAFEAGSFNHWRHVLR